MEGEFNHAGTELGQKVPAVGLEETEGVSGPKEVPFLGKFRVDRGSLGAGVAGSERRVPGLVPWLGGWVDSYVKDSMCDQRWDPRYSGALTRSIKDQRLVTVSARFVTFKEAPIEFPGCPVVRTLSFHCRRHRLNPTCQLERSKINKQRTPSESLV